MTFMIDSRLFRRLRFIYQGVDYQEHVRRQVKALKTRLEGVLGNKEGGGDAAQAGIPSMDDNG